MDVFRQSSLADKYQKEKEVSAHIENYEQKIVDEYKQLDLYRAKGKTKAKISFKDLTLQENLNYIKFNLKNTNEAFDMFDILKDKFASHPEIPASIVQKIANRS